MRYKNTGKVKENGVVYTPIEIANYISEELISLCSLTARNGYEVIFRLQQH